jgi:hypothetical protein
MTMGQTAETGSKAHLDGFGDEAINGAHSTVLVEVDITGNAPSIGGIDDDELNALLVVAVLLQLLGILGERGKGRHGIHDWPDHWVILEDLGEGSTSVSGCIRSGIDKVARRLCAQRRDRA